MATKTEIGYISEIADSYIAFAAKVDVQLEKIDVVLDIGVAHGDIPLRLEELATIAAVGRDHEHYSSFLHDISGIRTHLDRDKRCIINGFLPRFAQV